MAFLKTRSLSGARTNTRQDVEVDNEDRSPPHTILYITIKFMLLMVPPIRLAQVQRGGVQPPSQADARSMCCRLELCVTEVKIEAQAISGVPSPTSSVFFVFPYSAFPPVTCVPVAQRCLFEAEAVVYDGLTEECCIYPLRLFPAPPSFFITQGPGL